MRTLLKSFPTLLKSSRHKPLPSRLPLLFVIAPLCPPASHPAAAAHSCPACLPLPAGWSYSESLIRVLDDYRRRFPWLWAAIEKDATPGEQSRPVPALPATAFGQPAVPACHRCTPASAVRVIT